MRARIRQVVLILAVALVALTAPHGSARAQSLEDQRASGAVGERFDGYLVARDGGAQAFVDQVNAKRRQIYEERAKAQGVPAEQVGRVYAQEIIQKAAGGTWLLGPDGKWVQK